jgi:hypothetical protein
MPPGNFASRLAMASVTARIAHLLQLYFASDGCLPSPWTRSADAGQLDTLWVCAVQMISIVLAILCMLRAGKMLMSGERSGSV